MWTTCLKYVLLIPLAMALPAAAANPRLHGRLALRFEFQDVEQVTGYSDYWRLAGSWRSGGRYWNPAAGVQVDAVDGSLRSYFFGDDLLLNPHNRLSARLNHTEFGVWHSAINFANLYYSYQRWWVRADLGIGYAALLFTEQNYHSPLLYSTEAPESRVIYNFSLRPVLGPFALEAALSNYDDFEYHGFDDNGYRIRPSFRISDHAALALLYERRYAGLFIGTPTLTRVTWLLSFEYRF